MGPRKSLRFLLILWLVPAVLSGANLLFVLHSSAGTASVYNADTMEFLGSPSVGPGAQRAFGVPDPSNPNAFLKLYVITSSSIVVLNPAAPFSVRATLSLTGAVPASPNAAVLTPDGRRLLVAAGTQVYVVNTTDTTDAITVSLPFPSSPTGIAVTPNSRRAYVMSSGSSVIRIIEMVPFVQLLSLTPSLPAGTFTSAIGMAPNGSRVYVAGSGSVFEIDRTTNIVSAPILSSFFGAGSIVFDPDPPVSNAVLSAGSSAPILNLASRTSSLTPFTAGGLNISEVALPGGNRALFLAGSPGRIFQGFLTAGGPVSEITSSQFGSNAIDIVGSPDGRFLFIAFSDFKVARLDAVSSLPAGVATTSLTPTGVSAVYMPATQASQPLEIYGGNGQSGTAGATLSAPLAVRLRAGNNQGVFGQTITFTSTSGVAFSDTSATTNLDGVAETFVTVPVSTAVQVTATVTSGGFGSTQTFNLNGGATTGAEGLRKISGDRQWVVQGTQFGFPLVVRATNSGVPVSSLTLSASFPSTVTCPAQVLTDANGDAAFLCTAGAVSSTTTADISVSDPFGRTLSEPFRVTIVTSTNDLPTQVLTEGEGTLVGVVRQKFPDAVSVRALSSAGTGVADVGVLFSSQEDVTLEPALTSTDGSGIARTSVTFGCFVGVGTIRATLLTQNTLSGNIRFTAMPGPATQLLKRQGDNQSGNPGRRLDGPGQALLIRLADVCGNGVQGQAVSWTVSPAAAATLENVFNTTNNDGEASVLVRLSNLGGPFTVTASAGGFSATFNLTVNIVASRLVSISGNGQSVALGQNAAQPLVVQTQDANGIAAAGVDVTFRVASGSATVTPARATTDSQGRASATVRGGTALGPIAVVAEAVGQSVTFTLNTLGRVPVATPLAFVNGGSFRQGWTPGSLGVLFGSGLMEGITGVVSVDQAPFPTTLRGVRVTVEGTDAPIIALANVGGQEQINIQVPFNVPAPALVTVVITNNGSSATITGVRTLPVMPGIFEISGLAAALHTDFSLVSSSNPARRGEIILVFLTGLGATTPPVGTNVPGPVPPAIPVRQPLVGINGAGVEVLGTFYAPTLITAYQINFRIPEDARSGLANLSIIVDNVASQDAKVPIQ